MLKKTLTYDSNKRSLLTESAFAVCFFLCALILSPFVAPNLPAVERAIDPTGLKVSKSKGDLYALLVGISTYQDERINKLDFAANDAKAFGEVLKKQDYVYNKLHIKVLVDEKATKRSILKFLKGDLRKAGKNDTVVLFFSGHGVYDPERTTDFFFCPYDLELDYLAASGVKMSGLEFLRDVKTKRVLIVADACHSGGFSDVNGIPKDLPLNLTRFLREFENTTGRVILTSSGPNQLSWQMKDIEGQPPLKNSVFTYFLLQGLKGKADSDRNGIVTVHEAYSYAFSMTKEATSGKQEPQIGGQQVGIFPLTFSGTVIPPWKLKRSLLQAASSGNVKRVIELRAELLDITNPRDDHNRTTLMVAAEKGHLPIVKLVLEQRPDLEAKTDDGDTALIAAAAQGHTNIVKLLLEKGANPNVKNKEEESALTKAARNGHLEIVKALLEKGANVRARNATGSTALALASYKGHADIVKLLLDHKAEANPRDYKGRTALSHASRYGRKDVIKILAARIPKSKTIKPQEDVISAIMLGNARRVQEALDKGIAIETKTQYGDTPLTLAASLGYTEIAKALLNKGANVNAKINYGSAALAWAAYNGHADVVRLLLAHGAEVDARDNGGNTALTYAAQNGHRAVVELLCSHKANVNNQGSDGETPLTLLLNPNEGMKEKLKLSALNAIIKLILDKGAKTNVADKKGFTALMLASKYGYSDAVRMLLDKQADVNARNNEQDTALMFASANGQAGIVSQLIARGASVNLTNQKGANALFMAARNGHVEAVLKLLAHGADARAETLEGETPVEIASNGGYQQVVKMLESHSAK